MLKAMLKVLQLLVLKTMIKKFIAYKKMHKILYFFYCIKYQK
jgi:hypothetical protein